MAAGALVPIGVTLLSLPSSLFGGEQPNTSAQATVFSIELFIVAAIAVQVLIQQWLRIHRDGFAKTPPDAFVRIFGPIYLVILAILWASALPAYFGATDGITGDGAPVGNLGYATACFVAAALAVLSVAGTSRVPSGRRLDRMVPADERR